jgi:tetratricopeptide (TPR) repeat protein
LPEKYNIVLQNSHIGRRRYLEKLTQSKFTLTFVQNWGITNSRGFEAISCGCGAFYQDGSELGIFLDQNSSAIPYGIDNFDTVVIDTLDNWINSADIIGANAAQARQVYDYEEISRRYLILLSVYSALIDKSRKAPSKSKIKNISTIRYPNRSPVRILYNYDGNADNYLDHQQQFRNGLKNKDAYSALDAIGESYLYTHLFKRFVLQVQLDEHIQIMSVAGPKVKKNLQHLQDYDGHHRSEELNLARVTYKKLSDAYPNRLAAHFNYGRICYEIGDKESALATFKHILNDITLYYEPTDLLMWREFQDSLFDYERLMFALRNFEMTQDPAYYKSIKAAILESSLWYLGTILLDRGDHQKALEIFTKHLEPDAELQALFVLKFKLLLRSGKQREASGYIKEIFRNQPWIIAKFGQKIVDGISSNSLDHPLIIEAWLRFKNRLS